jgi:hypothetical protein
MHIHIARQFAFWQWMPRPDFSEVVSSIFKSDRLICTPKRINSDPRNDYAILFLESSDETRRAIAAIYLAIL